MKKITYFSLIQYIFHYSHKTNRETKSIQFKATHTHRIESYSVYATPVAVKLGNARFFMKHFHETGCATTAVCVQQCKYI